MGLSFKKKRANSRRRKNGSTNPSDDQTMESPSSSSLQRSVEGNGIGASSSSLTASQPQTSAAAPKKKKNKFGLRSSRSKSQLQAPSEPDPPSPPEPVEPTMDMVPQLTHDLAMAEDTSSEQAANALRMLFSLSEHSTTENNRAVMVQEFDGQLVPVLLNFLQRCERSSSEQYLALLVLNNVSIPAENKKPIAIRYGGAKVLSRLICEEPSCHLLAIILVNLTFADGDLRRELVASNSNIELVEALAYSLLIASSTSEEHATRAPITMDQDRGEEFSPRELLTSALKADTLIHQSPDGVPQERLFYSSKQVFPETARWCLSALKNLTRPSGDSKVAKAVSAAGIIPLILRIISVGSPSQCFEDVNIASNVDLARDLHMSEQQIRKQSSSSEMNSTQPSPTSVIDGSEERTTNADPTNLPSTWEANSIQDAALFTIMNLAVEAPVRTILREEDAVNILSAIADYATMSIPEDAHGVDPIVGEMQRQFQCLKARMALAYLVGSEGHFGQPRDSSSNGLTGTQMHESVLLVTNTEAERLIELLSNTLHLRPKEGPGGYSAATFSVKSVLYAIRCLLTNHINQITFAATGVRLNCLLFKAITYFTLNSVPTVDAEAAEHACFSLYLQSNYGFKDNFLPIHFGPLDDDIFDENESFPKHKTSVVEKILSSMLEIENITAAGRHAATQILLRHDFLNFGGVLGELDHYGGSPLSALDFNLNDNHVYIINGIVVEKFAPGAKPMDDIFARPILRSRAPKKGSDGAPWNQQTSVSIFPSALLAVQPLSFGSSKVRHLEPIDDILIANNISCSAKGEKTESYNYWWSWQDAAKTIQEKLKRKESKSRVRGFMDRVNGTNGDDDAPFTIFGLRCGQGGLCIS